MCDGAGIAERDLSRLAVAQKQRLVLVAGHFQHALEREQLAPLG
jgi:hypothetical protein